MTSKRAILGLTAGRCAGVVAALAVAVGCRNHASSAQSADAGAEAGTVVVRREEIARAEAARRVAELPKDALTGVQAERVLAVRALARIADNAAVPRLQDALHAESDEVVAWAAYGLGYTCKTREAQHVKLLAARFATLSLAAQSSSGGPALAAMDARPALVRAVARCGTALAEDSLSAWLAMDDAKLREAIALALGDLGKRQKSLQDKTIAALLAIAPTAEQPGTRSALYALGSIRLDSRYADGVVAAASALLKSRIPERIFALRALASGGPGAVLPLQAFLAADGASLAERAEAARSLGALGEPGKTALVAELARGLPARGAALDAAASAKSAATYADHNAALAVVILGMLGPTFSKATETVLYELAAFGRDALDARAARRLGDVRCHAAGLLARGTFNAELLLKCADAESAEWAFARLGSLGQRPLDGERKKAWQELLASKHVRVREAAIELVGGHRELADAGRAAIAAALRGAGSGVVATAADTLFRHPDVAFAQTGTTAAAPDKLHDAAKSLAAELDPGVRSALVAALARDYPEDAIEARVSLLAAAKALKLEQTAAFAEKLCANPNVTLRARGEAALRELGSTERRCELLPGPAAAVSVASTRERVALTFQTAAGELRIQTDPDLAPITVAHMIALVEAGFFNGIVVHRVVPSFVVQFGDPQGDGFGGSGKWIPCETSPAAFMPLTAGMALAGRDTGSSQLFVTLVRAPHLDGEYTTWGSASGPWAELAEGDVIERAQVQRQ